MKHFFYAVYVLFYTGAVFMAGMFVGQFLERARAAREEAFDSFPEARSGMGVQDPKVAVMRKREHA